VDTLTPADARRPRFHEIPLFAQLCVVVSVGTLLVAAVCGLIAWQQHSLFESGSPTPTPIRAEDLKSWAEGDNVHVTVTEFGFGEKYITTQRQNEQNYQGLWVPLLPPEGRRGIRVVAYSSRIKTKEQLAEFVRRNSLTGILSTRHGDMPMQQLEEGYPGVDFSRVMVLSVDQNFPRPIKIQSLAAAAGILLVAAAAGLLAWRVRWRKMKAVRLAAAPLGDKAWLALIGLLLLLGGFFGVAGLP
jgi:hypothetical protein